MIVIAGIVFGAVWGAMLARRRKGRVPDIVQYAAIHAIVFGLLGLVLTIIIERLAAG